MAIPSATIDNAPAAKLPLRIVVSDAGNLAALKSLVGQCVPMLFNPDAYSKARRAELAEQLTRAIRPGVYEADACETAEEPYEPGVWLEEAGP